MYDRHSKLAVQKLLEDLEDAALAHRRSLDPNSKARAFAEWRRGLRALAYARAVSLPDKATRERLTVA